MSLVEITGDDIIDGNVPLETIVPDVWTGEHVAARIVRAFEIERRIGGRIGPRGAGACWPEYWYSAEDLSGWATEHRERVFQSLAARVGSVEVDMAEEAMTWPMRYLAGEPLERDAVLTWCRLKGYGRDVDDFMAHRRKSAENAAERFAAAENLRLATARAAAAQEVLTWFRAEYARRQTGWSPSERDSKFMALRNQAENRLKKACDPLHSVEPVLANGAGGRVVTRKALRNFRIAGFALIAERLARSRVMVR